MRSFTIILVISLLLCIPNINSQGLAPLQLDNIWIYNTDPGATNYLNKRTVVDTNAVMDSIIYAKVKNISNDGDISYSHMRLNEDGYYVYPLNDTLEFMYYKKNAIIGDTWTNPNPQFPELPAVYTVLDTFVAPVFGSSQTVKYISRDWGILLFYEYWTEKFGMLSSVEHPYGEVVEALVGCVIDGVAYGDTSFTIVSVEDEFVPREFVLSQNFPNPFNPTTSINFTLPEGDFIILEVFNALGDKVKTLVNEFKPAGTHTIQFKADGLASGIYFYTLTAGNFTETKKLILLK